jgi:hypothetical protein
MERRKTAAAVVVKKASITNKGIRERRGQGFYSRRPQKTVVRDSACRVVYVSLGIMDVGNKPVLYTARGRIYRPGLDQTASRITMSESERKET